MRLVLDTNVVLDLIVFDDAATRPLRDAIERGEAIVFTCDECLDELRRVLAYPAFALDKAAQDAAYDRFLSITRRIQPAAVARTPGLPRCRDADDQKFLLLADAANADRLLTKDSALLELADRMVRLGGFAISPPVELVRLFPAGSNRNGPLARLPP